MAMNSVNHYKNGSGQIVPGSTLSTLLSGEDQTNNVLRVEEQNGYFFFDHGTVSEDTPMGVTGDEGDLLVRVTVLETPNAQTIDIYDGVVATGQLVLVIPTAAAAGDTWELGIQATTSAGFVIDDKSDDQGQILAIGRFT